MSITTRKFSEFTDGGDLENSNTTVGLEGGANTRFNNPWTFLASGTTGDRPAPAAAMYYRLRFNTTLGSYEFYDPVSLAWVQLEDSGDISDLIARLAAHTMGDGASMIGLQNQTGVTNKTVQDLANATIIAQTDNGTLTNGQFMDDLANGVMYNTGGVLGADANFTTNGTGTVSITGQLNVDNLRLDGNSLSSTNAGGELYLQPNPTGALITGSTATIAQLTPYVGGAGILYMIGSTAIADNPNVYLIGLGEAPLNVCAASNASAVGSYSPLINGNFLGIYDYLGDDGTSLRLSAQVLFAVEGSVSTGIVPSRYIIRNTDSSGNFNDALIINADGNAFFFNNISGNNFLPGYATTATAATTTTLTVNSRYLQYFTGVTTQTVVMPVTSTLVLGQSWRIVNNSSGALTINSSGSNLILTMAANTSAEITCILTSGTTAASWNSTYISDAGSSGIVSPGNINELAYYAATGSTVSGITTANNAILTTNASGVPSWTAATFPITWSGVPGATQAAAVNKGYIIQNAATTTVTLPLTAAIGSIVAIAGLGAGGWVLTANTGQTIKFSPSTTSSAGSLASTSQYDTVEVVCITADTTWSVRSAPGLGLTVT
jgi:hypothetical protein